MYCHQPSHILTSGRERPRQQKQPKKKHGWRNDKKFNQQEKNGWVSSFHPPGYFLATDWGAISAHRWFVLCFDFGFISEHTQQNGPLTQTHHQHQQFFSTDFSGILSLRQVATNFSSGFLYHLKFQDSTHWPPAT